MLGWHRLHRGPLLVLAGHPEEAGRQLAGHRRRLFDATVRLDGWRWEETLGRVTHPCLRRRGQEVIRLGSMGHR